MYNNEGYPVAGIYFIDLELHVADKNVVAYFPNHQGVLSNRHLPARDAFPGECHF